MIYTCNNGKERAVYKIFVKLDSHLTNAHTYKNNFSAFFTRKKGSFSFFFFFFFFTDFVMFASRLRLVSTRLAIHSIKPFSINNAIKVVSTAHISRSYATKSGKQVSYTADKFPGYVRNENFKKASTYKQKRIIFSNILIYSSLSKTLNILKQLLVKMD